MSGGEPAAEPRKDMNQENRKSANNPVVLLLRLWRMAVWVIFVFGIGVSVASIIVTQFYNARFSINGEVVSVPRNVLLYQLGFLLGWIAVFVFMLRFASGPWREQPESGVTAVKQEKPPWRVSGEQLEVGPSCNWLTQLSFGGVLFAAGCTGLYKLVYIPATRLYQASQVQKFEWELEPGLVILSIIFVVLLFLGYGTALSVHQTRFDLLKRTFHRRSGVYPFVRVRRGNIEEDVAGVFLQPSGHEHALPGDEDWKLSIVWKSLSAEKCLEHDLLSRSGQIKNGRNTATAEMEELGRRLARLLGVPFRVKTAWWETNPKEGDQSFPSVAKGASGEVVIPSSPLPGLGYSSPLQYRFRQIDDLHAVVEPSPVMLRAAQVLFLLSLSLMSAAIFFNWVIEITFFSGFGLVAAVLIGAVAFFVRSQPSISLDREKAEIHFGQVLALSRVRAVQICYAGRTKHETDPDGSGSRTYDVFQILLVEKGDPPRRHGILAGEPITTVRRIGRLTAGFLGVPLIDGLSVQDTGSGRRNPPDKAPFG